MTDQIIVVEVEEDGLSVHLDLVTSMFPCILSNGKLLISIDLLDEVEDSGIPYSLSTIG